MHDTGFVKYLQVNSHSDLLLESLLDVSRQTKKPIQKIIPETYDFYLKSHGIKLEDIEIDEY